MPEVVRSAVIEAPAQEIFAFLAQAERNIEWVPRLAYSKRLTSGPTERGTQFGFGLKFAGVMLETVDEVTDIVPGRLISFESASGIKHSGSWRLEPIGVAGDLTLVTYEMDFEWPQMFAGVLGRLLNLESFLEEQAEACLHNLRQILEKEERPSSPPSLRDSPSPRTTWGEGAGG